MKEIEDLKVGEKVYFRWGFTGINKSLDIGTVKRINKKTVTVDLSTNPGVKMTKDNIIKLKYGNDFMSRHRISIREYYVAEEQKEIAERFRDRFNGYHGCNLRQIRGILKVLEE